MKRSVFPYLFAGILAALLVATAAFFATAQAWPLPSVEDTGPKAKDAQLGVTFTGDFVPSNLVDAIVRQQSREYLQRVIDSMVPRPPQFTVGLITALATNPQCEKFVYLSGWVVETATKVELRVDALPSVFVPTKVTTPGFAKVWEWCIPPALHDGKIHKLYARAIRASGTVIGPLDNAKSAARFEFSVVADSPFPPPPGPVPAPDLPPVAAFTDARVQYAAGVVTVEAKADFDKVELLIDSRDVAPWYQGLKTLVNGKAEFTLPPAAMDGAEHLLDVRLYKTNAPGVFRPDGYPIRAKLIAP